MKNLEFCVIIFLFTNGYSADVPDLILKKSITEHQEFRSWHSSKNTSPKIRGAASLNIATLKAVQGWTIDDAVMVISTADNSVISMSTTAAKYTFIYNSLGISDGIKSPLIVVEEKNKEILSLILDKSGFFIPVDQVMFNKIQSQLNTLDK